MRSDKQGLLHGNHDAVEVGGACGVFDLFLDKAQVLAGWVEREYGVTSVGVDTAEEGFRDADVITVAASRLIPLEFKNEWIKEGSTILVSGPVNSEESFWTDCKIVYDHTPLQQAYVEDAIASGDRQAYYSGVIGGPLYRLIDAGRLPPLEDSTGMGEIANGRKPGREDGRERIVFIACGMAVFDIAWGYEVLENARREGIGQELNLWKEPCVG